MLIKWSKRLMSVETICFKLYEVLKSYSRADMLLIFIIIIFKYYYYYNLHYYWYYNLHYRHIFALISSSMCTTELTERIVSLEEMADTMMRADHALEKSQHKIMLSVMMKKNIADLSSQRK